MCFEYGINPCLPEKKCETCFINSFASHEKSEFWSDKNKVKPWQMKKYSHKKFWFNCNKSDHIFESELNNITNGKWCPYPCCSKPSRKLCSNNKCNICHEASFASHEKSEFWSDKNSLTPREIFKNSHKKCWFKCDKSNHEFESILSDITANGSWCPYPCCSKPSRKLCSNNECNICFEASFASHEKSEFWSDKNNLTPREILKQSNLNYWFKCNKSNHEFEIRLGNIIHHENWCPYPCCANKKICIEENCDLCFEASFASNEQSKFWSNKNELTPRKIFKNTIKTFLFKCDFDHEYEAMPHNITQRNDGCPKCRIWKNQIECLCIIEKLTGKKFKTSRPRILNGLELDGYNDSLKLAIEYNGEQHYKYVQFFHKNNEEYFEDQQKRDILKKELCIKNNIYLIIVPYWVSNKEDLIKTAYQNFLNIGITSS